MIRFKVYYLLPVLLLVVLTVLSGCQPATKEEKEEYEKEHTSEYEITSIFQYIAVGTNGRGAVKSRNLAYAFTYIDENGDLHTEDEFVDFENGNTHVCISDEDKYVVVESYKKQSTSRYLYLTKDTLNNMPNQTE